jgi:hypothetical protein
MKKMVFSLIILAALSVPLFAQKISEGKESEYFYVNVPLEKIYPYRKGYVVQYRKGVNQMGRAYLPVEWFEQAASRAELLYLGPGNSWPYLTVYYKNGAFDHVRLYVHRSRTHETWGSVSLTVNIDDRFENVDDLKLEF